MGLEPKKSNENSSTGLLGFNYDETVIELTDSGSVFAISAKVFSFLLADFDYFAP